MCKLRSDPSISGDAFRPTRHTKECSYWECVCPSTRSKPAITRTRREKETAVYVNALGRLDKTRNDRIPDFHSLMVPLFTKLGPHLFMLYHGSCVSNPRGVDPPQNPCMLCGKYLPNPIRPNGTSENPASVSKPTNISPAVMHGEPRQVRYQTKL